MASIKRVTLPLLALVLVGGVLIGLHLFVRAAHHRMAATVRAHANLPHLNRLFETGNRPRELIRSSQARRLEERSQPVEFVYTGGTESPAKAKLPPSPPQLMPVPAGKTAVPLPPLENDWPATASPDPDLPACKPVPPNSKQRPAAGRRLIDRGLPGSSAEERDLWHETTKDLPMNDLRELLRLRTQLGPLSPPFLEARRSQTGAPLSPPGSALRNPGLFPPAPNGGIPNDDTGSDGLSHDSAPNAAIPFPASDSDSDRILAESLAAIRAARRIVLNNIANARANGYKRRLVSFEAGTVRRILPSMSNGAFQVRLGDPVQMGTRLCDVVTDLSPGKLVTTNRSLDIAIDGPGFFQVSDSLKNPVCSYTRCGRLTINAAHQLALHASGKEWVLTPAVTLPASTTEIHITPDGMVSVWDAADLSTLQIGQIHTACIPSDALIAVDRSVFTADARSISFASPASEGHGSLRQGCLEESNVDVNQELAELGRLEQQAQALEQAARLVQRANGPR